MHSPTVAPAASLTPPPSLPPPAAHTTPTRSVQPPPQSKGFSRGGLLPSPHTPSLSNRTPMPPLGPPATLTPTTGGRPQEGRHHSPNPPRISIPPKSSLKLDPSTPSTPASPRPKPSRKRSHNRTRSSSKASTTQQVSASPSVSSLRDNKKEAPHMASASASPNIQSFDPRTNIDTLVERVRAMAMAGSAIDRDKDKEGIQTPHDGHIDWAGDVDDSLPDLDDWVKPKHSQHKEAEADEAQPEKISKQASLPPVVETANPGTTSQSQDVQMKSGLHGSRSEDNKQQAPEPKGNKKLKTSSDVDVGRAKPRGKHGRKKSITSEVSLLTSVAQSSAGSEAKPSELMKPIRPLPPLVHPLPPKPQISAPLVRGPRSRGPTHVVQPMARTKDTVSGEVSIPSSCEEASVEPPSTHAVEPIVDTAGEATVVEPQVQKMASSPTVDWANAPPPTQNSSIESVREALEPPSSSVGAHPDTHTRKRARAFDPSIDWSKAPTTPEISSPPAATHFPSSGISSPPSLTHLHAALPQDRSRSPFPRPNSSPLLSSARTSPRSSIHTRSQMNSPERSPRRRQEKEGLTHSRAHSSPQTGPGIRTHTSRPVITLDALSRISRTLGLPGATTPPRGPTVEVIVAD